MTTESTDLPPKVPLILLILSSTAIKVFKKFKKLIINSDRQKVLKVILLVFSNWCLSVK